MSVPVVVVSVTDSADQQLPISLTPPHHVGPRHSAAAMTATAAILCYDHPMSSHCRRHRRSPLCRLPMRATFVMDSLLRMSLPVLSPPHPSLPLHPQPPAATAIVVVVSCFCYLHRRHCCRRYRQCHLSHMAIFLRARSCPRPRRMAGPVTAIRYLHAAHHSMRTCMYMPRTVHVLSAPHLPTPPR